MITHVNFSRQQSSPLKQAILMTLFQLAPPMNDGIPPLPEYWPTTRQIANALNISIYQARYGLLSLVALGRVIVSDNMINNSLRWYPYDFPGTKYNDTANI